MRVNSIGNNSFKSLRVATDSKTVRNLERVWEFNGKSEDQEKVQKAFMEALRAINKESGSDEYELRASKIENHIEFFISNKDKTIKNQQNFFKLYIGRLCNPPYFDQEDPETIIYGINKFKNQVLGYFMAKNESQDIVNMINKQLEEDA